jgi:hypothetical protein
VNNSKYSSDLDLTILISSKIDAIEGLISGGSSSKDEVVSVSHKVTIARSI